MCNKDRIRFLIKNCLCFCISENVPVRNPFTHEKTTQRTETKSILSRERADIESACIDKNSASLFPIGFLCTYEIGERNWKLVKHVFWSVDVRWCQIILMNTSKVLVLHSHYRIYSGTYLSCRLKSQVCLSIYLLFLVNIDFFL